MPGVDSASQMVERESSAGSMDTIESYSGKESRRRQRKGDINKFFLLPASEVGNCPPWSEKIQIGSGLQNYMTATWKRSDRSHLSSFSADRTVLLDRSAVDKPLALLMIHCKLIIVKLGNTMLKHHHVRLELIEEANLYILRRAWLMTSYVLCAAKFYTKVGCMCSSTICASTQGSSITRKGLQYHWRWQCPVCFPSNANEIFKEHLPI